MPTVLALSLHVPREEKEIGQNGKISIGCDRHSALKFGSTDKIENGFLREIPAFIDFTGWEIQVIQRQSFFMGFMHAFFAFQTQKSLKNMCGMPVTPNSISLVRLTHSLTCDGVIYRPAPEGTPVL